MLPYHNTTIKHQNEAATIPLVLPVHLVQNVPDEVVDRNIRFNSRSQKPWLKQSEPHGRVAVLCGSGPSLADSMLDIRVRQAKGEVIFAMNGAAKFLAERGIMPDYQVILDARLRTAGLVGPAKEHLFASQVDPECFRLMPTAQLWQLQVENIDDLLPEYNEDYCLVGGGASVGNSALCLAFAMGYREMHCYGYDSCHKDGNSHAFRQAMNDGEPCATVEFGGKTYYASLTMKLQAEKFQVTAGAVKSMGAKVFVHGYGLLPDMYNVPEKLSEAEKYERMWLYPEYRAVAPGEVCAETFLLVAEPKGRVIDFGCGTGRGALKIKEAGCDVLLVDFAPNCLDPEALILPFRKHDLTKPLDEKAEYGYCTDVMEHIPPEQVDDVLKTIFASCDKAFFQISLVDDVCGALIGRPLHLSVHPYDWWLEKLKNYGEVVWSFPSKEVAMFYVRTHGR